VQAGNDKTIKNSIMNLGNIAFAPEKRT
jgi:hypothetical protein